MFTDPGDSHRSPTNPIPRDAAGRPPAPDLGLTSSI